LCAGSWGALRCVRVLLRALRLVRWLLGGLSCDRVVSPAGDRTHYTITLVNEAGGWGKRVTVAAGRPCRLKMEQRWPELDRDDWSAQLFGWCDRDSDDEGNLEGVRARCQLWLCRVVALP
jgi:hypothetical protein